MADIDVRTDSWRKHSTKVYSDGLTVTQGATAYTAALTDHAFGVFSSLILPPYALVAAGFAQAHREAGTTLQRGAELVDMAATDFELTDFESAKKIAVAGLLDGGYV